MIETLLVVIGLFCASSLLGFWYGRATYEPTMWEVETIDWEVARPIWEHHRGGVKTVIMFEQSMFNALPQHERETYLLWVESRGRGEGGE